MEWVKLYTKTPRDPAIRAAQGRHPHALALFTLGLCYAGEQETDGMIPATEPSYWGLSGWKRAADALVREGLWEPLLEGGWLIPNWLKYQQSKEEAEEARRKAAERQRRKRERDRHAVTSHVSHATRVEESRSSTPYPAAAGGCPAHPDGAAPSCRGCGTNPRAVRADARKARWGTWCGACDERTRMYDDDQGRAVRCSCREQVPA